MIMIKTYYHVLCLLKIYFYKIYYKKRLLIENGTTWRKNFSLSIEKGGGKDRKKCIFNNGCSVAAMDRVEIGNDCLFGENVKIFDHNHRFNMKDLPVKKQGYTSNRIIIGNNNWIGSNVVILKGVKIGENCVVGAGCVVDTDIEDNCIVKNIGNYKKEFIVFK